MKFLVFIAICILNFTLSAQNKIYTVKPGEKITEVIPTKDIYKYPGFYKGTVFLKDGTSATPKMNYHKLFGEMKFIDPKGDTLSLSNENTMYLITINRDSFYLDKNFLELISNYGKIKMAAQTQITLSNKVKYGAL